MSQVYWNPEIETMPRDHLHTLQLHKLQRTVAHCYAHTPFFRQQMDVLGVTPDDILTLDDIRRLPFTYKTDLRDNYPFGMFAVPMDKIIRLHATSGTTGKPTTVGYTRGDIDIWAECAARSLGCAGGTKNDMVQVSYGYGLFTGGLGMHYGVEKMGATALPTSSGNTQRQIMLMQDYGTNLLCCTPSYALLLLETMQEMGIDTSKLALRAGCFGAEAWTEGMRQQIEAGMGIDALDIYGTAEMMGPGVAMECREAKHGLHIWEDYFLAEIINPDTNEPVPDGTFGELTITTLGKEAMPILRYRTRDLTCIIPEPCICGRTHRRIHRLRGRVDDMLIIRGVNVFPSQIEAVLTEMDGIMPHYQLLVDRANNLDTLEVQVEVTQALFSDEVRLLEALQAKLTSAIQATLGIGVKVRLMEPKSIARSEGKAKRIIDNRKLYD